MSAPARKDSGIELETENEPVHGSWKNKNLFPSESLTAAKKKYTLLATVYRTDSQVQAKAKALETDVEENKRLSQHIKARPQMEVEERVLRTEIYWLTKKIADQRRIYGVPEGDHIEKSNKLRLRLEEKRSQLKDVECKRHRVEIERRRK